MADDTQMDNMRTIFINAKKANKKVEVAVEFIASKFGNENPWVSYTCNINHVGADYLNLPLRDANDQTLVPFNSILWWRVQ
jgi:hypothetical protein